MKYDSVIHNYFCLVIFGHIRTGQSVSVNRYYWIYLKSMLEFEFLNRYCFSKKLFKKVVFKGRFWWNQSTIELNGNSWLNNMLVTKWLRVWKWWRHKHYVSHQLMVTDISNLQPVINMYQQHWCLQYNDYLNCTRNITQQNERVTVMLVTSLCWWLYDGDWFEMLVAESLCWRLFFVMLAIFSMY